MMFLYVFRTCCDQSNNGEIGHGCRSATINPIYNATLSRSNQKSWSDGLLGSNGLPIKNYELQKHLMKAPKGERKCPKGYFPRPIHLNPNENCKHEFKLQNSDFNHVILQHDNGDFNEKDFCLVFQEDGSLAAELCKKQHFNRFE